MYQDTYVDVNKLGTNRVKRLQSILEVHEGKELCSAPWEGIRRNGTWTFNWIVGEESPVTISQDELYAIGKELDKHEEEIKEKEKTSFCGKAAYEILLEVLKQRWGCFLQDRYSLQFSHDVQLGVMFYKQVGFYAKSAPLEMKGKLNLEIQKHQVIYRRKRVIGEGFEKIALDSIEVAETTQELLNIIDMLNEDISDLYHSYAKKANYKAKHSQSFQENLKYVGLIQVA